MRALIVGASALVLVQCSAADPDPDCITLGNDYGFSAEPAQPLKRITIKGKAEKPLGRAEFDCDFSQIPNAFFALSLAIKKTKGADGVEVFKICNGETFTLGGQQCKVTGIIKR